MLWESSSDFPMNKTVGPYKHWLCKCSAKGASRIHVKQLFEGIRLELSEDTNVWTILFHNTQSQLCECISILFCGYPHILTIFKERRGRRMYQSRKLFSNKLRSDKRPGELIYLKEIYGDVMIMNRTLPECI